MRRAGSPAFVDLRGLVDHREALGGKPPPRLGRLDGEHGPAGGEPASTWRENGPVGGWSSPTGRPRTSARAGRAAASTEPDGEKPRVGARMVGAVVRAVVGGGAVPLAVRLSAVARARRPVAVPAEFVRRRPFAISAGRAGWQAPGRGATRHPGEPPASHAARSTAGRSPPACSKRRDRSTAPLQLGQRRAQLRRFCQPILTSTPFPPVRQLKTSVSRGPGRGPESAAEPGRHRRDPARISRTRPRSRHEAARRPRHAASGTSIRRTPALTTREARVVVRR